MVLQSSERASYKWLVESTLVGTQLIDTVHHNIDLNRPGLISIL